MDSPTVQPSRRWWQHKHPRLSIRMLMLTILLVGGVIGWMVNWANTYRQAVNTVRKAASASGQAGFVTFDDVMIRGGRSRANRAVGRAPWWDSARWAPGWLRTAVGEDYFRDVLNVSVDFARLNEAESREVLRALHVLRSIQSLDLWNPPSGTRVQGLTSLSRLSARFNAQGVTGPFDFRDLPGLEDLYLEGDAITDESLVGADGSPRLRSITLRSPGVSGSGLKYLAHRSSLQRLLLTSPNLTDQGLVQLEGLTGLRHLELSGGLSVSDAGLAHLAGLSGLNELFLRNTAMSDASLGSLRGLAGLKHLQVLNSPAVTDRGVAQIARNHPQLQVLDLTHTSVSDAGLEHLRGLRQLANLNLTGPKISDGGMAFLKEIPELSQLQLRESSVGDSGMADLGQIKSLTKLVHIGPEITDAGLAHLAGLTELQVLMVARTRVTDAGLAHLSGMKNLTTLSLGGARLTNEGITRLRTALPTLKSVGGLRSAPVRGGDNDQGTNAPRSAFDAIQDSICAFRPRTSRATGKA